MKLIDKLINMGYEQREALAMIMAGRVLVNEEKIIISSQKIKETDLVRIKENKEWVSRGAYKLLKAIEVFNINVKNKVCLDVGSSTGGFTEVLLKSGAKKIYALDSGSNQLDFKLRQNEKIISLEKTNLKTISEKMFCEKIDFLCCDVSFISVKNLFKVLNENDILNEINDIVILIKPQFEAEVKYVENGGYVKKEFHDQIIKNIIDYAKKLNFEFLEIIESPIKGNKSKNIEYLTLFRKRREYE